MSNADYSITGTGSFCTIAILSGAVAPLATTFNITGLKSVGPGDRFVGMAVLIDHEVVRLESISSTSITVARGCADTIPTAHAAGAQIWFFETTLTSNGIDYVASGTIGVKVLPATTSGTLPIAYAPPEALTFNSRFVRPYPPGNFRADAAPWFSRIFSVSSSNPELTFTWVQRNRVVQQDVLVSHTESTVTPESGTTYTAVVRLASNNSILRTVTGITGTTWDYTNAMATTDIGAATRPVAMNIDFCSVRDGFESWQKYRTAISAV